MTASQHDPYSEPPQRKGEFWWILLHTGLGLLGLACLFLAFAVYIVRDPDIPHGGDPREDRRGLLRSVPEPVLRDIANHIRFRASVVVEAVENGQHDLWLVENPRYGSRFVTKTTRLTDTPANETYPVWSPDGKWIAYFSDATGPGGSPGKREVFALRVADGKIVQATNAPEIEWGGPLDWIFDDFWIYDSDVWENWIILNGRPVSALAGDVSGSGIFKLPMSGPDRRPVRVENTEGAVGLPWSSDGMIFGRSDGTLAYIAEPLVSDSSLTTSEMPEITVVSQAEHARGLDLVPGAFTWLSGGIVYMTRGEPPDGEVGVEITVARPRYGRSAAGPFQLKQMPREAVLSGRLGTVQSIIPLSGHGFLALQDGPLDGSGTTGCLNLRYYNIWEIPVDPSRPAYLPDLCIDPLPEGLHPQAALIEENIKNNFGALWRVFSGRRAGERQSSLYAVLFFDQWIHMHHAQLRPLPAQIRGEIVPGSARIQPKNFYDAGYLEAVSEMIDP